MYYENSCNDFPLQYLLFVIYYLLFIFYLIPNMNFEIDENILPGLSALLEYLFVLVIGRTAVVVVVAVILHLIHNYIICSRNNRIPSISAT